MADLALKETRAAFHGPRGRVPAARPCPGRTSKLRLPCRPLVRQVGDMASWHRPNDPPLNSPLESLAAAVSGAVLTAGGPPAPPPGPALPAGLMPPGSAEAAALAAARRMVAAVAPLALTSKGGAGGGVEESDGGVAGGKGPVPLPVGGPVVTLVVPHDLSWQVIRRRRGQRAEPAPEEASDDCEQWWRCWAVEDRRCCFPDRPCLPVRRRRRRPRAHPFQRPRQAAGLPSPPQWPLPRPSCATVPPRC